MLRSILTAWRPVALAAALLALVAAPAYVQAAGHAGGFHGGGFNGGGFHGGGFNTGGFHAGGYSGGFHSGGYNAGGFHSGGYNAGGYHPGYYSGYHNGYSGYHNGYGYDHRGYGYYGGYYSPWLYGSPAYISGGYDAAPNYYYSPGSYDYAPNYGAPDGTPTGKYIPDAPTPAPDSTPGPASVYVHVPASAELWFDGTATKQTGEERQFVSPSLTPGKDYTYDVRASWTDNGQAKDETRTITVHANGVTSVDFTQPAPAASTSK